MSAESLQVPVINYNLVLPGNSPLSKAGLLKGHLHPFTNEKSQPISPFDMKSKFKKPEVLILPEVSSPLKSTSTMSRTVSVSSFQSKEATPLYGIRAESETSQSKEIIEPTFESDHMTEIVGYGFIVAAFIFFAWIVYAMFGSIFVGQTGQYALDAISQDRYYVFLLPLFVPVTAIFGYLNWLSLKFFKHT